MAIITAMLIGTAGCGSSGSASNAKNSYADASSSDVAGAYEAAEPSYYDEDIMYEESAEMGTDGIDSGSSGSGDVEVTENSAKSNRKLIRTVNLNVETYEFDSLIAFVPGKVNELGGYIESSSVDGNSTSYGRSANYTLRIPAAKADGFIAGIGADSNITHQSESMEDVTLKYVDINSRKESLKVEYSRLEELLKEAEDIEELIYIENRLSEVRYEIESIESQLRSYDNLVDYTTIYLYVTEVQVYTEPEEPEPIDNSVGARISRGLSAAFENISQFLQDLVVAIVLMLPYLLIIAVFVGIVWLIIWLIIRASRKRAEKRRKNMPPVPPVPQAPGANMNAGMQAGPYVQAPGAPGHDNTAGDDKTEGVKND